MTVRPPPCSVGSTAHVKDSSGVSPPPTRAMANGGRKENLKNPIHEDSSLPKSKRYPMPRRYSSCGPCDRSSNVKFQLWIWFQILEKVVSARR